jgi:hypothetical protein
MSPRALPRTTVRSLTTDRDGRRIACPPEASKHSRAKRATERFPQVSPRRPVSVTLTWYPRSTPWVKVEAQGRTRWVAGHVAIVDVCMLIHGY